MDLNTNGNSQNSSNNNYYNSNNRYIPNYTYQPEPRNVFAIVAMVLGLCSLLSLCTLILSVPLGALSIIFVVLSKRQQKKMAPTAITGLVTSLVGILASVIILISLLGTTFSLLKPENRGELNRQFEQIYGMDFDEYMEQIYGDDFDDIMKQLENNLR